ncbi:MAG: SpoIIE family protein phosphatase [Azospirillaceae bacterium]|nr:SpoIIE family protein phosphatase [Azospirillaceae bacterium]
MTVGVGDVGSTRQAAAAGAASAMRPRFSGGPVLWQRCAIAAIVVLLLGVGGTVALGLVRVHHDQEREVDEKSRFVARLWNKLIDQGNARTEEALTGDLTLLRAVDSGDTAAVRDRIDQSGIASLAVVDAATQPLIAVPNAAAATVISAQRVGQILSQNVKYSDCIFEKDGARLVLAMPMPGRATADRVVIATRPIDSLLGALAGVMDGSVFIVTGKGIVLGRVGALAWDDVRAGFDPALPGMGRVDSNARVLGVLNVRLPDIAEDDSIFLVVARETSLSDMADTLSRTVAVGLILLLLLAGGAALVWYHRRAFGPFNELVTALSAVADGETAVAVPGGERRDEIGQIARTLQVFLNRSRAMHHGEGRRARQWNRQQVFIRRQMLRMAETLPEEGRRELLADLERIEAAVPTRPGGQIADDAGTLAVAFEVMAERVGQQHGAMDRMLCQLQAALNTKTELVELQKQFEIARKMQQSILPVGLPVRDDLQAHGLLVPGAEFDGAFYDFFINGDDLVIIMGQVEGGGLAAGFLTVAARAAVRVLAGSGLGPADCLTAANRLLTGDNATGVEIGLLVGIINVRSRRFAFSAAGIPEPFLLRRLGDVIDVATQVNLPLGIDAQMVMVETVTEFPVPGTLLICGSGLLDAVNGFGVAFSRAHMTSILSDLDDLSVDRVLATVASAVAEHAGGVAVPRDRICLAVRVRS